METIFDAVNVVKLRSNGDVLVEIGRSVYSVEMKCSIGVNKWSDNSR